MDIAMNDLTLPVVLSVMSAAAYAAGAVLQERLAAAPDGPSAQTSDRFGSLAVLRRGRWWLAVALNVTGGALHMIALRYGLLTVVQPLGALTLVLALPISALVIHRRVTITEWRGAAMVVAGLAGLLLLTSSAEPAQTLSLPETLAITAATTAILATLIVSAAAARRPLPRSLWYAAAAGLAFGVSSALTQTIALHLSTQRLSAMFGPGIAVEAIVVTALATAGLLLSQAAFRGGLGAPLATATLVNPIAAATIGLTLAGEGYTAGVAGAALALAAAAAAGYGVVLLAKRATPRAASVGESVSEDGEHDGRADRTPLLPGSGRVVAADLTPR